MTRISIVWIAVAVFGFLVGGCASTMDKLKENDKHMTFLVAAENIDTQGIITSCFDTKSQKDPSANADTSGVGYGAAYQATFKNRDCVSRLVAASQENCAAFVNGLVLTENTVNTSTDMATTLFAALATIFIPLNTVHALSGAATVSSGWRTAINSDIYAKASTANYANAIRITYYKDMDDFIKSLNSTDDAKVDVWHEAVEINSIHSECALASANSTIATKLQSGEAQSSSDVATKLITIVDDAKAAESIVLTAKFAQTNKATGNATTSTEPVKLEVKKDDKKEDIAKSLAKNLNDDTVLAKAKVTATSSANVVTVTSPSALNLVWTVSGDDSLKLIKQSDSTPQAGDSSKGSVTKSLTVQKPLTKKETVSITVVSTSALPNQIERVTYAGKAGDTAEKIAEGLYKAMNANSNLSAAKIGATEASPPSATISLYSPSSAGVIWILSDPQLLSLKDDSN